MPFDLESTKQRAERRLGPAPDESSTRRRRADRGRSRLHPDLQSELDRRLGEHERPSMTKLLHEISALARRKRLRAPSRATLYTYLHRAHLPAVPIASLSPPVRETLFNLDPGGEVPLAQLAFHCFNYGGLVALSYGASLPWLALHQALEKPGWRPRSAGLARAVLRARAR